MKIFKLLFLIILYPLKSQAYELLTDDLIQIHSCFSSGTQRFKITPTIAAKDIPLTDGWLLNGKYKATVPSTIMGVLTANGEYPNILEGLAYKDIDRSRFDQPFIYSKEFELTTKDLEDHIFLQLDGISYRANIYLNGKLVADKNTIYGAYRRHTLDITKYAQAFNKLEIEVFIYIGGNDSMDTIKENQMQVMLIGIQDLPMKVWVFSDPFLSTSVAMS